MDSKGSTRDWLSCLVSLKSKLSREVFDKWIRPLKVFDINDFQLVLSVPLNLDIEQLVIFSYFIIYISR